MGLGESGLRPPAVAGLSLPASSQQAGNRSASPKRFSRVAPCSVSFRPGPDRTGRPGWLHSLASEATSEAAPERYLRETPDLVRLPGFS